MFFVFGKSKETTFEFSQHVVTIVWLSLLYASYKLESQKIVNLLNDSDDESSNLQQKSSLSFTIKTVQTMAKTIKTVRALNSRQKISNLVFVIIQMHIFL